MTGNWPSITIDKMFVVVKPPKSSRAASLGMSRACVSSIAGNESTVADEPPIVSLTYEGVQPPTTDIGALPEIALFRLLLKFHTPTWPLAGAATGIPAALAPPSVPMV